MLSDFAKYEGAGNDFIIVDGRNRSIPLDGKLIAKLCDRHFGIGADGLMVLGCGDRSPASDFSMRYYNADGSEGEMCGNGARCVSLFAEHLGIGGGVKTFRAADGLHTARIISQSTDRALIEVGLKDVSDVKIGKGYYYLNTGVPHYVEFTDNLEGVDVVERGRAIRNDSKRFPEGVNVNFVHLEDDGSLSIRTYERGVEAETLACGTGSAASAIAVHIALGHNCAGNYKIHTVGGELTISFSAAGNSIYRDILLAGNARRVFVGSLETDNF